MSEITKTERFMYNLGYAGLLVSCFCWGWDQHLFKKDK